MKPSITLRAHFRGDKALALEDWASERNESVHELAEDLLNDELEERMIAEDQEFDFED